MTIGGGFGKKLETLKESITGSSNGNSLNETKYNFKKDALTDYFRGKLTAEELNKIAKDTFGTPIATKKELQSFLTNKFTQDIMSDTFGVPSKTLVKKARELVSFTESISEAILKDRDYQYDNVAGVVKISKKNFSKVHTDSKSMIKGKPFMMVLTDNGTSLVPVQFESYIN